MKKLFLALCFLPSVTSFAQTAEQIVERYTKAMGGLDAFNKTQSAKITGTLISQGNEIPFTLQVLNGKGMRMDLTAMGEAIVNVYYEGKGWKINPFANAHSATDVTGAELLAFKAQASLANNLMDYKNRGHKIELLGQAGEESENVLTFKIKLTAKEDGKVTTYYISQKDYLLVKSVTRREIAGAEYETDTFYSETSDAGGPEGAALLFSMHFIQKVGDKVFQEVKYSKVELDVPIDIGIFEKQQ